MANTRVTMLAERNVARELAHWDKDKASSSASSSKC